MPTDSNTMTPAPRTVPSSGHRATWIALALGLAVTVAQVVWIQPWTLDDAYISMRFADNLAAGQGAVYNPGERVEGYTTFLWVVLLALGGVLGLELEAWSKWLGAGFAVGTLLLLANADRFSRCFDGRSARFAVLLTATCGIFSVWSLSGMEVSMTGFWITLAALWFARATTETGRTASLWLAGITCALATMSRPDCGLVLVVLWCGRLIQDRGLRPGALRFGAAFGLVYVPYFVWRYSYYGYLLPNTFYAKVGQTWDQVNRGLDYVGAFSWVAMPLLVAAILAARRARTASGWTPIGVLLALVLAHTAYVVSVGGDVMPAFRFFATLMPVICLLAGVGVSASIARAPALAIAVTAMCLFNIGQFAFHNQFRLGSVGLDGREIGLWMRDHYPPDTLLATNAAGGVAYFSRLRTIDMLGLADSHIAHREMPDMGRGKAGHEKGDGAYVLAAKPDIIQFGSSWGRAQPVFVGDHELHSDPEFHENYELKRYRIRRGLRVTLYERTTPTGR